MAWPATSGWTRSEYERAYILCLPKGWWQFAYIECGSTIGPSSKIPANWAGKCSASCRTGEAPSSTIDWPWHKAASRVEFQGGHVVERQRRRLQEPSDSPFAAK
eukprot:scaffold44365_cov91-Phaeocystis_antarctica.AAC.2